MNILAVDTAGKTAGVALLQDDRLLYEVYLDGGMRACRPTHHFSTGCRAGCPHPAGTVPLQPIYGQSQYTRPSSALGRGLGRLQSPR